MNIRELHAQLSMEIGTGNADLPVVLECDHGQTPMKVTWCGTSKVNEDDAEWEHDGDTVYLIYGSVVPL